MQYRPRLCGCKNLWISYSYRCKLRVNPLPTELASTQSFVRLTNTKILATIRNAYTQTWSTSSTQLKKAVVLWWCKQKSNFSKSLEHKKNVETFFNKNYEKELFSHWQRKKVGWLKSSLKLSDPVTVIKLKRCSSKLKLLWNRWLQRYPNLVSMTNAKYWANLRHVKLTTLSAIH